jgi:hypothetical protein
LPSIWVFLDGGFGFERARERFFGEKEVLCFKGFWAVVSCLDLFFNEFFSNPSGSQLKMVKEIFFFSYILRILKMI